MYLFHPGNGFPGKVRLYGKIRKSCGEKDIPPIGSFHGQ
jgi:hypothetical protein